MISGVQIKIFLIALTRQVTKKSRKGLIQFVDEHSLTVPFYGVERVMVDTKQSTPNRIIFSSWMSSQEVLPKTPKAAQVRRWKNFDLLYPLKQKLNAFEVHDRQLAHQICQLIPAQCPFARDVKLFGHTLFSIPPLCKLNPLYDEVVALRFRALCYLADECGEDISIYC